MFYENKCGQFEFHVYLKGLFCFFSLSLCDLFPADAEEATERLVPALWQSASCEVSSITGEH